MNNSAGTSMTIRALLLSEAIATAAKDFDVVLKDKKRRQRRTTKLGPTEAAAGFHRLHRSLFTCTCMRD